MPSCIAYSSCISSAQLCTPCTRGSGQLYAGQAEALDPAAAARIWEGQLAGVLLAEDGGLALSHLATTAAHGFMPKIQTQGQLGHAHWRLVSAPSIPGEAPFGKL